MTPSTAHAITAALALLGLARAAVAQDPARPLDLRNDVRLDSLVEEYRAIIAQRMQAQHVPGLAIALVDRDGMVWGEGFGHVDEAGTRAVDTRTTFSLQSSSKSLTALAVLLALQDGLLDLDAPVTTYVPRFTVQSRLEQHPERRMTMRHLLSHHAGFTHEAPVGNNYTWEYGSFQAHIRSISDTWLRFPVGQRYSYANLGVDLAGHILGLVSGSSFWEYMQRRLLGPLGMTGSSFDWDVIAATENRALGHWPQFDSIPLRHALIPSGGLYSNVEDMAEFIRFHLNAGRVNGRALIARDVLQQQYTIQFPVEGQVEGYCLGLRRSLRYGTPHFHHNGGGYGFQSHVAWYPTYGFGVVVLSNAFGHNLTSQLPYQLVDRIFTVWLAEFPRPAPRFSHLTAVDVEPTGKRRFIGSYIGRGASLDLELRGDTLGLNLGQQGGFAPLHFASERDAYADFSWGRWLLRFTLREDGSPIRVTRVHDGDVFDYDGSPNDLPGPDKPHWADYVGTYHVLVWGTTAADVEVDVENGHLRFNGQLVEEYLPGLFFNAGGEALDFRSERPTWRNIELTKRP